MEGEGTRYYDSSESEERSRLQQSRSTSHQKTKPVKVTSKKKSSKASTISEERNHRERDNKDQDHANRERSHKRHRSRSPLSLRGSYHKSHQDERPRSNHRSGPSYEKKIYREDELASKHLLAAKNTGCEGTTNILGSKQEPEEIQEIVDGISSDDKDSFEQAIAAAQELASKQPSYLNALAKPMTQQQKVVQEKRKLLWSGKKNKVVQSRNQWENVSLGKDGEDNKFRRLMGIGAGKSSSQCTQPSEQNDEGSAKSSEGALTALEQQYDASRFLTHVARGAGLGYGSQALTTELPSQKDFSDKLHETL